MPFASRSARCSGLERSARMPPWILGWRVLTRPPSISGEPVTSATSRCAMPASFSLADVLPLATSSQPRSRESLGQLDQTFFVVDRKQRPHNTMSSSAPFLVRRSHRRPAARPDYAWLGRPDPAPGSRPARSPNLVADRTLGGCRPESRRAWSAPPEAATEEVEEGLVVRLELVPQIPQCLCVLEFDDPGRR